MRSVRFVRLGDDAAILQEISLLRVFWRMAHLGPLVRHLLFISDYSLGRFYPCVGSSWFRPSVSTVVLRVFLFFFRVLTIICALWDIGPS